MNKKICCFGELLMRLSPHANNNWIEKHEMPFYIGGAEFNTAAALARWKVPVKYITSIPDNYFSRQIIEYASNKEIDMSGTLLSGNRMGIYYLPVGSELKNAGVIYDRAHSSFSELRTGILDWEKILEDCSHFHFSAICPAVSKNLVDICKEALEVATKNGLKISIDLNHRSKLWQYGNNPPELMPALLKHCDVVMGNMWAAESLLGIASPIKTSNGLSQEQLIEAAKESIMQLQTLFPKISMAAYTFRLENNYWAVLMQDQKYFVSKNHQIKSVVDKVGSGDCFMAGLLYGMELSYFPKYIIDFAAAAAVGKLQEAGDITNQTVDSIYNRMTVE